MTEPTAHRCVGCGLIKPREAFYPSAARRGYWCCRECRTTQGMKRYWENRAYVNAFKLERGCADCGYRGHPAALQFDHLPGTHKLYKVTDLVMGNRKKLDAEIAKCEVVCANCHAIRTVTREQETQTVAARRGKWQALAPLNDPQLGLFG